MKFFVKYGQLQHANLQRTLLNLIFQNAGFVLNMKSFSVANRGNYANFFHAKFLSYRFKVNFNKNIKIHRLIMLYIWPKFKTEISYYFHIHYTLKTAKVT